MIRLDLLGADPGTVEIHSNQHFSHPCNKARLPGWYEVRQNQRLISSESQSATISVEINVVVDSDKL